MSDERYHDKEIQEMEDSLGPAITAADITDDYLLQWINDPALIHPRREDGSLSAIREMAKELTRWREAFAWIAGARSAGSPWAALMFAHDQGWSASIDGVGNREVRGDRGFCDIRYQNVLEAIEALRKKVEG